jgi:hypothetical protein
MNENAPVFVITKEVISIFSFRIIDKQLREKKDKGKSIKFRI